MFYKTPRKQQTALESLASGKATACNDTTDKQGARKRTIGRKLDRNTILRMTLKSQKVLKRTRLFYYHHKMAKHLHSQLTMQITTLFPCRPMP